VLRVLKGNNKEVKLMANNSITSSTQVVDLDKTKALTEQHLLIHQGVHNSTENPNLYGAKFPYGEVIGKAPQLVSIDQIKTRGGLYQTFDSRFGTGNPEHNNISTSIHNGLKLNLPGIFLVQRPDGLYPLTGHTRLLILKEMKVTNVIATIYDIPNDSDASAFSLELNPKQAPAGAMTVRDVVQESIMALKKGWIKPENDDQLNVMAAIQERVERICKNDFTEKTKNAIVIRVYKNSDYHTKATDVISWETPLQINTWMTRYKYIDTPEVMYMVASASTVSSVLTRAAALAAANIGKQIRIVLQTGTLDSANLLSSYNKSIETFRLKWDSDLNNIRSMYFAVSGTGCARKHSVMRTDDIVLYGSLPAVMSTHKEGKIIPFPKDEI
jgi:hypothetical protein